MTSARDFYVALAFAFVATVVVGLTAALQLRSPQRWATANWNAAHNACVDFYGTRLATCPTLTPAQRAAAATP